MITNDFLLTEQSHPSGFGGVQRIYRFANGMGLSAVNSPMLHVYSFAWEIAVLKGVEDSGDFEKIDYTTDLTEDVEVFTNDDDANEFIARAATLFGSLP